MKQLSITAGEYAVDRAPAVIETFLGSCVGIALYDRSLRMGGMLHVILPAGMAKKEQEHPAAYVSSGLPFLLDSLRRAGADCRNLVAALVGGANIREISDGAGLRIGRRNIEAARRSLRELAIPIILEEVGGHHGRQMHFFLADGRIEVRPSLPRQGARTTAGPSFDPIAPGILAETIAGLKPVSQTAMEALTLVRDPSSSFPQIERLILRDQLLAASVLRLVNSAYYGLPVTIHTISQALAMIGLQGFRKLVMQVVAHHLCARPLHAYSMEEGALFHHSLAVAQLAETLARIAGLNEEETYLAGLLHDLGKVALERCAGPQFQQVIDLVCSAGMEFHLAEKTVLGTDHPTVGGEMAIAWRLPELLAETIACHHRPLTAGKTRKTVCAVHVADALANVLGIGPGTDSMANFLEQRVFQEINLSEAAVENLLAAVPKILHAHI